MVVHIPAGLLAAAAVVADIGFCEDDAGLLLLLLSDRAAVATLLLAGLLAGQVAHWMCVLTVSRG
jgi:hypothetical protein